MKEQQNCEEILVRSNAHGPHVKYAFDLTLQNSKKCTNLQSQTNIANASPHRKASETVSIRLRLCVCIS